MLEQICYKEIKLDDGGNSTLDNIKDNALDRKKFLSAEKYLVTELSIKPVINKNVTKWNHYPKIENLSKKISSAKITKGDVFDLTVEASIMRELNEPYIKNLKLLNQLETKTYEYFNTETKKRDKITFKDYEGLFVNKNWRFQVKFLIWQYTQTLKVKIISLKSHGKVISKIG